MTNLGASLGTALAGAILFGALASGLVAGVNGSTALPPEVQQQATVEISKGVSIVSDAQLQAALSASNLSASEQQAILTVNDNARANAMRDAMIGLAIAELGAILVMRRLPTRPASAPSEA